MRKMQKILLIVFVIVLSSANVANAYKYDSYKQDSIIKYEGKYYRIVSNNLIANNSFEDGLGSWKSGTGNLSGSYFTCTQANTPNGISYALLTNSRKNSVSIANSGRAIRTSWEVTEGSMYYFSFYLKKGSRDTFENYYLQWVSKASASSGTCLNSSTTVNVPNPDWMNLEYVAEATSNYLQFAYGGVNSYWLDEFYLFKVEVATSTRLESAIEWATDVLEKFSRTAITTALNAAKATRGTKATEAEYDQAGEALFMAVFDVIQEEASKENPVDLTNWIVNPSFEMNPPQAPGWTAYHNGEEVPVGQGDGVHIEVKVANVYEGEDGDTYYMRPCDGHYAFNSWYEYDNTGLFVVEQTLENVPNGVYSLSALAATGYMNSNVGESGYLYNVDLFANDSVTIPASDFGRSRAVRRTLPTVVVGNHTLKIGISSYNWFKVDDFRLTYYGVDLDVYTSKLDSLLDVARSFSLSLLPNGVDALLLAVIEQGESAKASADDDAILAAIASLYDVFPTVRSSIPSYGELDNLVEYFAAIRDLTTDNPTMYSEINSYYQIGLGVYEGAETLQPEVEETVALLRDYLNNHSREIMSYGTCVYPVNISYLIYNNSFEINPQIKSSAQNENGVHEPEGWTLSKTLGSSSSFRQFCEGKDLTFGSPSNRIAPDGEYHYNAWAQHLAEIDLYQTITNLPEGYYSLSAYMLTREDTKNDQHVYILYNGTSYNSPSVRSISFEKLSTDYVYIPEGGSIRIGAASSAPYGDERTDNSWFAVDYLTLSYYRLTCTLYYDTNESEGDWSSVDHWKTSEGRTIGELPMMTSDVMVSGINLTVDQQARVRNITVAADAHLSIDPGKTLTVNHLTLKSNANGTATLIDTAASLVVKEGVVMEQFVTGSGTSLGGSTGRGWYLSSPMIDAKTSSFWNMEIKDIWSFSEAKGDVLQNSNPYTKINNAVTPLVPGAAYQVRMWKDTTVRFSGTKFNTGDLNVPITRGTVAKKRGFNLVGNPYPSHVKISEAMDFNTMSPTIWYRTATVDATMVFDTYNCATGVGTGNGFRGVVSDEVPPLQSLWVRLREDGSSDYVRFKNSQRSHGSATNLLRSAAEETDKEIVRVQISRDEVYKDETVLVYMSNATENYEDYDSEKQFNTQRLLPEIWTKAAGKEVVINALPPLDTYKEYPLGYLTYVEGYHKIRATEIAVDAQVVIKDLVANRVFDLTGGDEYLFYSSSYVDTDSRFVLLVDKTKTALDRLLDAPAVQVVGGKECIDVFNQDESSACIQVYSTIGLLLNEQILDEASVQIPLGAGVYLVKITKDNKISTQRIVVK